jgi:AraC-like DNA-binding protein
MELEKKIYQIKAKTYSQKVEKISQDSIFFQREHQWSCETLQVDAFAEFWSVALFGPELPIGCLSLFSGDQAITIKPNQMVYIPPFSLIRWKIAPSVLIWNSLLVRSQMPITEDLGVRILNWQGEKMQDANTTLNYVTQARTIEKVQQQIQNKVVGLKLKQWIDKNYRTHLRLRTYAESIEFSMSYLTKEFKACFDLTPQAYLNKLRSYEGMFELMLKGEPISGISYSLGYRDSSTFYKYFNKEFLSNPNEFKLP